MEVIKQAGNMLSIFAPLVILAIAILTAWGIIKWGNRLGQAFSELSKNPASFIFGLLVIALFLWLYFKYIHPLWQVIT